MSTIFFHLHVLRIRPIVLSIFSANPTCPFRLSVANDIKFTQRALNSTLFPNIPDSVKVHNGFADTQERTAEQVLGGVLLGLEQKNISRVLVVGHSLGAAVAMFDSMMLARVLPSNVTLQTVTFGQPRSGNQAWADLLDKTVRILPLPWSLPYNLHVFSTSLVYQTNPDAFISV
jgi:hypothetical protein